MWVTEPPPWKITLPVPLLLFVVLWSRSSARKQTNKQTKNVNLCGTKWVGAYQLVRRGNVEAEEEKVKAKSCNNTHIRKDRHLVKEQKKGMRPRKTILQAEKKKMMRLSLTTLCKGQREARRKEEQKKKKNSTQRLSAAIWEEKVCFRWKTLKKEKLCGNESGSLSFQVAWQGAIANTSAETMENTRMNGKQRRKGKKKER